MLKNKCFMVAALCLMPVLAGCGGEPSSSEIEKAVIAQVDQENTQMKQAGMGLIDIQVKVHSVKKIGCAAVDESKGYNCDVELDVSNPMTGRNKGVTQIRLVKGSEGWLVAQ